MKFQIKIENQTGIYLSEIEENDNITRDELERVLRTGVENDGGLALKCAGGKTVIFPPKILADSIISIQFFDAKQTQES